MKIFNYFFSKNNFFLSFCYQYLIHKYILYTYIFIFLISFIESLVFIGLCIPSSFIMLFLGFMIGKKVINFYITYFLVILGCFLGDLISYILGIFFRDSFIIFEKKVINKNAFIKYIFSYFKKNTFLFMLLGKFLGPLKSFLLFVSGMLLIPFNDIVIPNFISISVWAILCIIPGVFSGVAINIPNSYIFNIYLYILIFLMFMNIFMLYNWYMFNNFDSYYIFLDKKKFVYLYIIILLMSFNIFWNLQRQSVFYIFVKLLYSLFMLKL